MTAPASPVGTGIGLRQPHYREVFERRPPLAFLEVHSENFFLEGEIKKTLGEWKKKMKA